MNPLSGAFELLGRKKRWFDFEIGGGGGAVALRAALGLRVVEAADALALSGKRPKCLREDQGPDGAALVDAGCLVEGPVDAQVDPALAILFFGLR